jgi:small subunit ribosomal protein S29
VLTAIPDEPAVLTCMLFQLQAFYTPRPAKQQRKGGCRALQAELALTHRSSLMWRCSTQELQQVLSSAAVPRMYLKGAPGSGKSIALVQMVEWARSNGW